MTETYILKLSVEEFAAIIEALKNEQKINDSIYVKNLLYDLTDLPF